MKKKFFLIILVLPLFLQAQIAITEVYYDTPFIERQELDRRAHTGEFIELFNYSKEDIDISGWKLTDNVGSYYFSEGTIIHSNDYLVVAYRSRDDYELNFFDLFSYTQEEGNEEKILYQDKFVLNNYRDGVTLWSNRIKNHTLNKYYKISRMYWRCNQSLPCNRNPVNPGTTTNSGGYNTNFNYYLPSFQKKTNGHLTSDVQSATVGSFASASPFGLTFTPQLMELEDIQSLTDILHDNYYNHISLWDGSYTFSCNNSIMPINEPDVSDTYIEELCFDFDSAGNQESNQLCSSDNQDSSDSNSSFLTTEEIANKIHVYPNPTTNQATITWENEVSDLITDIMVFSMSGSNQISVNNISSTSAEVYLGPYPTGLYAVMFELNTGEFVDKIIIKI